MWMETDPNTRINQKRLQQVMEEAQAELVVTSCPYCLIMFDDAIRSKGVGDQVAALDIAEAISGA
jgi:Fe-S oxidoreductase